MRTASATKAYGGLADRVAHEVREVADEAGYSSTQAWSSFTRRETLSSDTSSFKRLSHMWEDTAAVAM